MGQTPFSVLSLSPQDLSKCLDYLVCDVAAAAEAQGGDVRTSLSKCIDCLVSDIVALVESQIGDVGTTLSKCFDCLV